MKCLPCMPLTPAPMMFQIWVQRMFLIAPIMHASTDVPPPPSPCAPAEASGAAAQPLAPIVAMHKSKNNKRGQSVAREEQVAKGVALGSQPSSDAVENVNRVDFTSSSSDLMIAEVAAAVGKWEIVKQKKHSSRNVQQVVAKGVGEFIQEFFSTTQKSTNFFISGAEGHREKEHWYRALPLWHPNRTQLVNHKTSFNP
ncbi:hypothetical protein SADUNF_Sadunf08G0140400 [Salix dunnii]|uniref:Uncharacterized protein n=1 Tax=Salix dunnii TaxID=1413687 RepID=A0A835JYA9_9ROSI|nr:hypothetical protein SADUNF_Sadunf08G0140400 [Salix dunnii]